MFVRSLKLCRYSWLLRLLPAQQNGRLIEASPCIMRAPELETTRLVFELHLLKQWQDA